MNAYDVYTHVLQGRLLNWDTLQFGPEREPWSMRIQFTISKLIQKLNNACITFEEYCDYQYNGTTGMCPSVLVLDLFIGVQKYQLTY